MDERRRIRVYIAGTMTNGGKGYDMKSITDAIKVYIKLIEMGFVPHCPQLTMFCDFVDPGRITHAQWLELDKNYIDDCDVVLRMPGESVGADIECAYAISRVISISWGIDEFLAGYEDCYGKVPE
ncbi:hypothetical protein LCGC14_0330150 [marine sediment metagenome]|uniref:Uncharacterized protein n=1 Tax=marine sediment metagenome TaxID=412755 RepID=A0A0F9TZJ0_9ZZZZ